MGDGSPSGEVIPGQDLNNEGSVCEHANFSGQREGANAKARGRPSLVWDGEQARVGGPGAKETGRGLSSSVRRSSVSAGRTGSFCNLGEMVGLRFACWDVLEDWGWGLGKKCGSLLSFWPKRPGK